MTNWFVSLIEYRVLKFIYRKHTIINKKMADIAKVPQGFQNC